MKKLFILGMLTLSTTSVFAFPFRTTCGIVFSINDSWASNVSSSTLNSTLSGLNMNACGVFPGSIVYY